MSLQLQNLINNKEFDKALNLLQSDIQNKNNISNQSYVYYLMGSYDKARDIIINFLNENKDNNWSRLYYRLAKSYECTLDFDKMNEAYEKMYELLTDEEKDKSTKYMQDYYNRSVNYMRQWIISKGGNIENLQIQYYDTDYRGMVVSENLKPKKNIMGIPWECIISLEDAKKNNYYVKEILKANKRINSPHTYLALELLYYKKNNGNFMPYINCLPKYFNNVPINFTIDELQKLEGSFSLVKIIQKILLLKIEYNQIEEIIGADVSFSDFVWARTAVITRVYAIKKNNMSDSVLVPFADMANHETPPNTKWEFNDKLQLFTVETEQFISKGEPIYETYGYKCNYRYFVNYGFTVNNNKYEEATLIINPLYKFLFKQYITEILEYEDKSITIKDYINNYYDKINETLLDFIISEKMAYQVGYIYNDIAKKLFTFLRNNEEITKYSEIKIHKILLDIIDNTLKDFITTKDEDETLLKKFEYNFNNRNSIIARKEEKKILIYWKTLCSAFLELLEKTSMDSKSYKNLNKKMNKWSEFHTFTPYINELKKIK
jgi:histone-lysine N-methyltransferase SETD3